MVAHNLSFSIAIGFCAGICGFISWISNKHAKLRLKLLDEYSYKSSHSAIYRLRKNPSLYNFFDLLFELTPITTIFSFIIFITIIFLNPNILPSLILDKFEQHFSATNWHQIIRTAKLSEVEIALRPADWRDRDVAKVKFRQIWCKNYELSGLACEMRQDTDNVSARLRWCQAQQIFEQNACETQFNQLELEFSRVWKIEREAYLTGISSPDLRGRDLNGATMRFAFLAGVRASGSNFEGADLSEARLEGANLSRANLKRTIFTAARLEGATLVEANLTEAQLKQANLREANLNGATLLWTQLEHAQLAEASLKRADLFGAELSRSDLTSAKLEGAYLRDAQLKGASLSKAELSGAYLRDANLENSIWHDAKIGPAVAHRANLSSAIGLTREQLRLVIGDEDTLVPLDNLGNKLQVWSCWEEKAGQIFASHWDGRWLDIGGDWKKRNTSEHLARMKAEGWICPTELKPKLVGRLKSYP
ncbi:MAG: pentapeptide repeat-containing protein [Geminicoccaceae bacterium]